MPPRKVKKKYVKRLVEKRVAKAIEEYEKTKADSNNVDGSGSANTGGTIAPDVQGCSYKKFMNCKPHSFNGTEGVVGLKHWFKKMEQVFEICKCTEDDKVNNVKAMMTTKYCPSTEIQKIEQELWTLTLRGDDIEAYNNRFYELVLMCPELVPTEIRDENSFVALPERNQRKFGRGCKNWRQETARAYAAAPAKGRGYARNLPRCYPLQDVTCYGCGEKGHYKDKCPKGRNQQNEGARGRAYVVVENPQQNLNVVTGTFLLNDHYACILFDSGAEKSFVSSAFTPFINIAPTALNTSYEVELADGKVVSTNTILRSFDVIIGMDWLAYHRAVIDCYEKIVRIPLSNGEILEVQGERPEMDSRSLACIKADEKKLDDIRIV
ncbi:putative reverse transcriptase domain-containing protein [Tanacetum coccineum]